MPVVRYRGGVPQSIVEGSGPWDWVADLHLSGDLSRLAAVETTGPAAAFFSATWNAALGTATVRPDALLDFESFSAAGALPEVEVALRFVFDDGSRQEDGPRLRVAVLDRDDAPPAALSFSNGGTVAAGAIGAAIGTLSVSDPDSSGPFFFTFAWEDEWRFEVVDGVLKLRDGISLGLDDLPTRPVIIEVSDGRNSAAFVLDVAVTEPDYGPAPYVPPVLAAGETRAGFTLAGPCEALATRPAAEAAAAALQPGGLQRVVLDNGESVWLGPDVERVRFSDGWLGAAAEGPAGHAAALHRAILGEDADGAALAPLAASLRAGAGWAAVAADLLDAAPPLAGLGDAAFVAALAEAALGTAPDAASLALHAERLLSGVASRAQVAVDIALSPASLLRLAEDTPTGHWVADPFDAAAGQPARRTFEDTTSTAATEAATGTAWFM